jgi:chloramphenicol 3-O phosphotransferase
MVSHGKVIWLNGTSSSGKSTIAKQLQRDLPEHYIHTGIDHYMERVSPTFAVPNNGIDPCVADGMVWVFPTPKHISEVRLGPAGFNLLRGMYAAIAALAEHGNNVIIDDVVWEPSLLREAVSTLHHLDVLFVGVRCPMEVAERREQSRGDRPTGLVKAHYLSVHAHQLYDLEINTSLNDPAQSVALIQQYLADDRPRNAVRYLYEEFHAVPQD